MSGAPQPLLEVEGLDVVERGRRLVLRSSFVVREGQRALLVGPSGAGKSLFVDLLLGFAGPETPELVVSGSIRLDGHERLGAPPDPSLGAVFQIHRPGLFDDLSVTQNLAFGASDAERQREAAAAFHLGALERPVATLSGGEQVRTSLVRTLLHGAEILVLDEPTTGLDESARRQVVDAIAKAHRRLTLVVTHDLDAFEGFADVVLLLDAESRTIRPLDRGGEGWAAVRAALSRRAPPPPAAPDGTPRRATRLLRAGARVAEGATEVAADALVALLAPFAWLAAFHPLHGPRVRGALRRDLAPGVAVFVGLASILIGVTATHFLFERLPQRPYAEALFLDDLLAGLGVVQVRVVVPLLVSILLAAKLGASTAAWLGHMSRTRQIDALRLLHVPVRRHLLLPAAGGQLAASLVHTTIALAGVFLTSLVVFLWDHPGWSARYAWRAWFEEVHGLDLAWVAAKVGLSAVAVAAIAFRAGVTPKRRPEEIVSAIHATLLGALLAVLAVHAAFAFLEFAR